MRNINEYEKKYMKPGFEDYQVEYRRKKIIKILDNYRPNHILEIGCGMKPLFKYIDWKYSTWTIVEPGKLFFENAQKIVKDMGCEEYVLIYNESFPFCALQKGQFDFIICSSLLHEVNCSDIFLHEIANICSKDTIVHINVPNANSFHRVLAKAMGLMDDIHELSYRNIQLQQQRVYDLQSLRVEVENAGFFVYDSGSYFIKPFTHSQMYKMIEKNIIDENILNGLYEISEKFNEYGSEIYINAKIVC